MKRQLLSGNEAIARGAWEAGVHVGTGYPGTPSTEILEALKDYPEVYTEWSVNEKVALEVGIGASLAGGRTLVTMKHVGVNVAADPLFTISYIGVKGGLVIVSADDPAMHSSQNEQDNRNYAHAARMPMLEPADSQEARDFTRIAFELSEKYDVPFLLRSTTRISHARSIVSVAERAAPGRPAGFYRNIRKFVMIPAYARLRHVAVEERMEAIARDADELSLNRIEEGSGGIGFVTSGVVYQYVREAFPDAPILKLGMVYPLPENLIRIFADSVETVVVAEELDSFFESRIRAMGIPVRGKEFYPRLGELSPGRVRTPLVRAGLIPATDGGEAPTAPAITVPPRPPALCPGCPHRTVFGLLHELGMKVTGDIGCYTLGALPPFSAMDTCVDMGASIGVAQGIEVAEGDAYKRDTVAVIGDSTFAHSGITGLINAAYNGRESFVIVLDNGTTAMTGMQPNPFSGTRISGEGAFALDYGKLAEAVGIDRERFRTVDAYSKEEVERAVRELATLDKLKLLVVKGPCVILRRKQKKEAS